MNPRMLALACTVLAACTPKPADKDQDKDQAREQARPVSADEQGETDAKGPEKAGNVEEAATPKKPDGSAADQSPVPKIDGARFWVVGESELLGVSLDGKVEHTVALPEEVGSVIRRASGDFVGLALGDPGHMVLFGAGDPHKTPIPTVLPREGCEPRPSKSGEDYGAADDRLDLQDGWDFRLAEGGGKACAMLYDRNINMASYGLDLEVDLTTSKVKASIIAHDNADCYDDADDAVQLCQDREPIHPWIEVEPGGPWEGWTPREVEATTTQGDWRFTYDFEAGSVADKKGEKTINLCGPSAARQCLEPESVSTSYRWLLLHGPVEEGDYIHRDLFLFDRDSGELMTIRRDLEGKGGKVGVIAPSKAFADETETFDAVGESDIDSLPGDRFWLDGTLLIPERRELVSIGGGRVLTAGK